jgi:hypothetical protein
MVEQWFPKRTPSLPISKSIKLNDPSNELLAYHLSI